MSSSLTTQSILSVEEFSSIFPLRCVPFEHYMFHDDTETHPMSTYAQLELSGPLNVSLLRSTFPLALRRHPLLCAVMRPIGGSRYEWVTSPQLPMLDIAPEAEPIRYPDRERIDLTQEPGLRLWVRTGDSSARLVMQTHHACVDGRGKFGFLTDWLALYGREMGAPNITELPPVDFEALQSRNQFERTSHKKRSFLRRVITIPQRIRGLLKGKSLRLKDTQQSYRPSETSSAFATERLTTDEFSRLRNVVREAGVSLTDWLVNLLFQSLMKWHGKSPAKDSDTLRIMIPTDLRKDTDQTLPACNKVGLKFLKRSVKSIREENLLPGIHEEMEVIRKRETSTFLWAIAKLDRFPHLLRRIVHRSNLRPTAVLSNLGNFPPQYSPPLPVEEGRWRIGDLIVEEVLSTIGVRKGNPLAILVMGYAQELVFICREDYRNFHPEQTRAFLKLYVDAIRNSFQSSNPNPQPDPTDKT